MPLKKSEKNYILSQDLRKISPALLLNLLLLA
jgi:hypothetical protein